MAKTVKMSDIAEALNVSTVTVSKALSNQKGVSEEMRAKVKEMSEQMGYKKYLTPKGTGGRGYNIGVLMSEVYVEKYATFYWQMYQAINAKAVRDNCFVLLEVLSTEDEKALMPPKLLTEGKVQGLLVLGAIQSSYLKLLKEDFSIPLIFVDFYDSGVIEDAVISNSFYGTYTLTNYLIEMGHRNIAFVGTLFSTESITDRYFGYVKSLMEHGIKPKEEWLVPDRDQKRKVYEEIPLPEDMPSAFVCNCDLIAAQVIKTLKRRGIRVPEDVSVVGFDDYIHPGLCNVGITTYAVNMSGMAEAGLQILYSKINGDKPLVGMHMVEGEIVIKESVRKINE
ncbi:MAG: LacI family DNA-binding transcriptional regulator [Lachnospiraceae bacterium]|nr:LacI family DNA-binding transcriptional regulator [Lachnospiraceae bacterium]